MNAFEGKIDLDNDPRIVKPGNYRWAKNIVEGTGAQNGAVQPVVGTQEITWNLPAGTTVGIGSVEDKVGQSVIFFFENSNNNHTILQVKNGTPRILAQGAFLNFSANRPIHSAKVVNGELLYWTDGTTRDGPVGNEPSKINIEKAYVDGKTLQYELHLTPSSFVPGSQFWIQVDELDGTPVTPLQLAYTVGAGGPDAELTALIVALAGFNVTATIPGLTGAEQYLVNVEHDDPERVVSITGLAGNDIHFVPRNHYPVLDAEMIAIMKPVPANPPEPRYVVDATVLENKVGNRSFKFRYRYVFDDGERSAWSAESYVPTNFAPIPGAALAGDVQPDQRYSKITIAFDDDYLGLEDWKSLIVGIELAVQNTDEGIWRLVDFYPSYLLGVVTHEIDFYNDGVYAAVPSDDAGEADVQALKNFDFVPRVAMGMESIVDQNGNYILAMAGCLENFDLPKVYATVAVNGYIPAVSVYPDDQTTQFKTMKSGGVYRVFVVYEDQFGRQSSAVPLGRVRIPFSQVGFSADSIQVDFHTPPPLWATRFRLAISKNQNQGIYFQVPAWEVQYWNYDPTTDDANATTFAAGDANYVGFSMNSADIPEAYRSLIFENLASNEKRFVPQPLDRLQILNFNNSGGTASTANIEQYNYPIVGYNLTYVATPPGTFDKFTVFVKFDSNIQPDFGQCITATDFFQLEIYRPINVATDGIPYEFGPTYDIMFPGDPAKVSHGPTITLNNYGDAFITTKPFDHDWYGGGPYKVFMPQHQRNVLNEVGNEVLGDLGRPVVYDPDYKEVFRYEVIRASDIYVPNSLVNGLSSWRGLNYIRVSRDLGYIEAIKNVDSVLLAIARYKSQSIYVGRGDVIDLSGNSLVGRSSDLLNPADEMMFDLGTQHPESVVVESGRLYAYDQFKKTPWRYTTGGGQLPISEGVIDYFQKTSNANYIHAGYDRANEMYLLGLGTSVLAFKEGKGWKTEYEMNPNCFGRLGLVLYTVRHGSPWSHDLGYCSFHGVDVDAEITYYMNQDPSAKKTLNAITIQADKKWWVPLIQTLPDVSYPNGMKSEIIATKITPYEGLLRADVLRDYTDDSAEFVAILDPAQRKVAALLRGRPMRGDVFLVTLRLDDSTELSTLLNARFLYRVSKQM